MNKRHYEHTLPNIRGSLSNTYKAIIAYDAVVGDWGNAYGSATAIRIPNARPDLTGLRPEMFGIQLIHPREAGIYAARNGVDLRDYFLPWDSLLLSPPCC